jgi:DNA gyrase subunit B
MAKKKYTEQDITVLEWREAVRLRPAMYLGSTGFIGFTNLLKSIFPNEYSIIEAEHYSLEIIGKLSVKLYFQNLNTPVSSLVNEVLYLINFSFAVLNALSQNYQFILYDKNKNEILKQVYEQGVSKCGMVVEKEYFAESLEIVFELDTSIWEEFSINPYLVSDVLKEIAFLNKDKSFEFKYLENGEPCKIIYHFENGLQDLLKLEEMKSYQANLYLTWIEKDIENFSAEIGFAFSINSYSKPFFKSFVNSFYTPQGGTHADAMILGITKALKKYVKKYCSEDKFLFNNETELSSNFVISKKVVESYLVGVIRIIMQQPRFSSGFRTKLESKEVMKPLTFFIYQTFFQILENDRAKANDLIKHFHAVFWKKSY